MEYKCIDYTNYFLKFLHCVAESEPIYGVLPINDLPDAQRNFKDTVFRMLFREKKALLSLYNAVNKTNFTNVEDMEIPTPRFVVFYNGTEAIPERKEHHLSDLFEKPVEKPELELTVTVYNINPGMNDELLEACNLLKEYVQFTEKIRENRKTMELKVAVNKAVDDCIKEGILEDFLREQRAEVIAMSIYEYDQEMHMQVVKEEGWEDGLAVGQNKMLLLIQHMQDNNELHLLDMLEDKNFLQQMYDKYSL